MERTRKTSKEALNDKIEKAQVDVASARERFDAATEQLQQLLDKRDAMRKEELDAAVARSERSYEEIMEFLAGSNLEEQKS